MRDLKTAERTQRDPRFCQTNLSADGEQPNLTATLVRTPEQHQQLLAATRTVIKAYDDDRSGETDDSLSGAVEALDDLLRLIDPEWRAYIARGDAHVRELLDQKAEAQS